MVIQSNWFRSKTAFASSGKALMEFAMLLMVDHMSTESMMLRVR